MSSDEQESLRVTGHCYCGAIQFAVDIPAGERPIFSAYCHCDSCRRAHAAPLYQVVCVDASMFSFVAGESNLVEFKKGGRSPVRAFCGTCGSKVLNRFPGWSPGGKVPLVFFPSLLDAEFQQDLPALLRPQKNINAGETVLEQELLNALFEHAS